MICGECGITLVPREAAPGGGDLWEAHVCQPRVRVADLAGNDLGMGTYVGEEMIESFGVSTPKIELDRGCLIYGYECWWTPVDRPLIDDEETGPR